jgi:hypothetical protein
MKLIGLMPARNEEWVLGLSLRAAVRWCDVVVVLDHASTDGTLRVIDDVASETGRVLRLRDENPEWDEMRHRQRMLSAAREHGATHVALVDADEVLTGNLLSVIRGHIEALTDGEMLYLPGYNLRGGIDRYHANGIWGNRWFATAFKDDPRASWRGDQFHHREPHGVDWHGWKPVAQSAGGVMHLWGASERRLLAKHRLYKMTEASRWPDKSRVQIDRYYNQAILPSANMSYAQNWEYASVPESWWLAYSDLMLHLHVDDTPWQEAECRRLMAQHGAIRFRGLDLFGGVV